MFLTYIIILNWNGWPDTIECLESVFRNHYDNYRVIVCDNSSEDDSLEKIKKWAEGAIHANINDDPRIAEYTNPSVKKPIQYVEYDREQAEQGGNRSDDSSLILIQTGANLGFAGGNNVGMRYALARDDFEYIWLLNNDTVIETDALVYLVNRMKEKETRTGLCGSTLIYYHNPEIVQAYGGFTYNKWTGTSAQIGHLANKDFFIDSKAVEKMMFGVQGASVLVKKNFLNEIGLLAEAYFLYFEEQDWAVRGKKKYSLAYAPKSIVYHKEGGSIGANSYSNNKSEISDYYSIKNRLEFTAKFYFYALPTVYLGLTITIINRIRRRQFKRIYMIGQIIIRHIYKIIIH